MGKEKSQLGLDILGIEDIKREELYIPEWDKTIYVRAMEGFERGFLEAMVSQPGTAHLKNLSSHIAVICAVDKDGNQLWDESQLKLIGKKSGAALGRIMEVAQRMSYITADDIDSLVKNSDSAQSEGSGSN